MIIVLHEWEKFFYRILQKFTPTWYLQKFFGYDKAQIKREAKKNDSTDSNDKNNSSIAQNNRSPILGKSSFWQVIWITVKMAAAIFLFIYRQKNGLLNELLGGAEIGWTTQMPYALWADLPMERRICFTIFMKMPLSTGGLRQHVYRRCFCFC